MGPATDLNTLFLQPFSRKVYNDRTVRFQGRVYEVDAALVGQRIVLLHDPSAEPGSPLRVQFQGEDAGRAALVDPYANAISRGERPEEPPADPDADPDPDDDAEDEPAIALRKIGKEPR